MGFRNIWIHCFLGSKKLSQGKKYILLVKKYNKLKIKVDKIQSVTLNLMILSCSKKLGFIGNIWFYLIDIWEHMILPCSPILFERRIFIVDLETKFLQALVVINMPQFFFKYQCFLSFCGRCNSPRSFSEFSYNGPGWG